MKEDAIVAVVRHESQIPARVDFWSVEPLHPTVPMLAGVYASERKPTEHWSVSAGPHYSDAAIEKSSSEQC